MRGAIARVEMEVATTFAVSWKPFVKSKASAVATTMMTVRSSPSTSATYPVAAAPALGILDHDALEDVRHVLGGVDGLLEALEDVLPADHDHGVDAGVEQRGDRLAGDPVPVVLEPVDLDRVVRHVLEAAQ